MKKHYFHLLIIFCLTWPLYGSCQQDFLLPSVAIAAALGSFLLRLRLGDASFGFLSRAPFAIVLLASLVVGILWRNIIPAPAAANALYIGIISAWQSAAVFASIAIWLMPYSNKNIYRLTFASWAIVALSINVTFNDTQTILFRLFCVFSVANILIHSFRRPLLTKRLTLHYRQLLIFGLSSVIMTGFLFKNIALGLRTFDDVFMRLAGDFFFPLSYTNFLNISPFLNLTDPGSSAFDRRPVLEVDSNGLNKIYLKTQVFENYTDGTWNEAQKYERTPINASTRHGSIKTSIVMFRPLNDIIPSPYGFLGVSGIDPYSKDANGIIYAENKRHTRVLTVSKEKFHGDFQREIADMPEMTKIPEELIGPLNEIASEAFSGKNLSSMEKALALQDYLRNNFSYTLRVDFQGNNKGMVKMLKEKRSAYCSYFASALALLLRSQNMPARVVTGFMADEKTGPNGERILIRVRDAHAWVEVRFSITDKNTGETYPAWVPLDGTPTGSISDMKLRSSYWNVLADKLYLTVLRAITHLQNFDKEKAKQYSLFALLLVLLTINAKKLLARRLSSHQKKGNRKYFHAAKDNALAQLYLRYENLIYKSFHEYRFDEETDAELFEKLKKRGVPTTQIAKFELFIDDYRKARFGGKENVSTEESFRKLHKNILARHVSVSSLKSPMKGD